MTRLSSWRATTADAGDRAERRHVQTWYAAVTVQDGDMRLLDSEQDTLRASISPTVGMSKRPPSLSCGLWREGVAPSVIIELESASSDAAAAPAYRDGGAVLQYESRELWKEPVLRSWRLWVEEETQRPRSRRGRLPKC